LVQDLPPDDLATVMGQWLAECKTVVEGHEGRINQFLGDGFLAYWHDRPRIELAIEQVLQALRRLQEQSSPAFRVVLHLGPVTVGGLSLRDEENLSGANVHYVFRMEKLSGVLGESRLFSEPAQARIGALLPTRGVGQHPLAGFEGQFHFYAL
jgi:class 3 adenylate cyclase